jgi:hypothetical protein
MPHLDLSDDEAALIKELHDTIDNDAFPLPKAYAPRSASRRWSDR